MTANTETTASSLPTGLADVALIDAKTAAAAGAMSVSWWHEKVASGEAPQPAFRAPRCTRWRLNDVRAFWAKLAEDGLNHKERAEKLLATTQKASQIAQNKRAGLYLPAGV